MLPALFKKALFKKCSALPRSEGCCCRAGSWPGHPGGAARLPTRAPARIECSPPIADSAIADRESGRGLVTCPVGCLVAPETGLSCGARDCHGRLARGRLGGRYRAFRTWRLADGGCGDYRYARDRGCNNRRHVTRGIRPYAPGHLRVSWYSGVNAALSAVLQMHYEGERMAGYGRELHAGSRAADRCPGLGGAGSATAKEPPVRL